MLAPRRDSHESPFPSQRPLGALRKVMDRSGIILAGSGNTRRRQATFPSTSRARTSRPDRSRRYGRCRPLGAKLAQPDRQVVAVGRRRFMMSLPEMGTAVMNDIPAVFLVQNNRGYMSIRGGQRKFMGRHIASEFNHHKGMANPTRPTSRGREEFRHGIVEGGDSADLENAEGGSRQRPRLSRSPRPRQPGLSLPAGGLPVAAYYEGTGRICRGAQARTAYVVPLRDHHPVRRKRRPALMAGRSGEVREHD